VSGIRLTVVLFELAVNGPSPTERVSPVRHVDGCVLRYLAGREVGRRGRVAGEWGDLRLPFSERKMPLSGTWTAPCRSTGVLLNLDQAY